MIIERKENEIIFHLKSDLGADTLQDYLELFQFEEIVSKSEATEEEINRLVSQAKKGRWKSTKANLGL